MATSKNTSALDRHFGYTAKGSSFKTEFLAGLTTFFAMAYILMVNAGMFSSIPGVTYGAIISPPPFPPSSARWRLACWQTCRSRRRPAWV